MNPVAKYRAQRDGYVSGARRLREVLESCLQDAGLSVVSVTSRAKTVDSFKRKSEKTNEDDSSKYADPLREITDLVAARVITLLPAMVDQVCEVVRGEFDLVEEADKGEETRSKGLFGYASRHFVARLREHQLRENGLEWFQGRKFEIQVRTVAQHAWAEFEHDTRYKGDIPANRKAEFDRRFLLAAALAEKLDDEFTEIDRMYRSNSEERQVAHSGTHELLTHDSLRDYLVQRYPKVSWSGVDAYSWMLGLLGRQNITTVEELDQRLVGVDSVKVADAVNVRENAGQIRRLDDDLLQALGSPWIDLAQETDSEGGNRVRNLGIRRRLLSKADLWRG